MSFTTSTRSDLDSQGKTREAYYYDSSEASINTVQSATNVGKYTQSLNLNFGSSSTVIIPNDSLLHQVMLYIQLNKTVANQTLNRGWVFGLIDEITYNIGGTTSQTRISSKTIRQINMALCKTREKRDEMLILAGEGYVGASTGFPEGTIVIPLPWSSIGHSKKPFPTDMLAQPIQLTIRIATADKIYGGSQGPTGVTGLLRAEVFTRQTSFTDRGNSLAMEMKNSPSSIYQYPYTAHVSPAPHYNLTSSLTTRQTISLTGFENADLTSILISVHPTVLQKWLTGGELAPCDGVSQELLNLELTFAGNVIWKCPGNSARLLNLLEIEGSSGFASSLFLQKTPWTKESVVNYIYEIPMTMLRGVEFAGAFSNGPRVGSQVLQLSFEIAPLTAIDPLVTAISEAHLTYCYNSQISVQQQMATIHLD